MTLEQKKLLYEIAKWHNTDFYHRMKDCWTIDDYEKSDECRKTIAKLESEYKDKYGDLPEWQYIDDVWAVIKTLETELNI